MPAGACLSLKVLNCYWYGGTPNCPCLNRGNAWLLSRTGLNSSGKKVEPSRGRACIEKSLLALVVIRELAHQLKECLRPQKLKLGEAKLVRNFKGGISGFPTLAHVNRQVPFLCRG